MAKQIARVAAVIPSARRSYNRCLILRKKSSTDVRKLNRWDWDVHSLMKERVKLAFDYTRHSCVLLRDTFK